VLDEDELIEHWTLVGDELNLLTGRTGPSRLWLKFFIAKGPVPVRALGAAWRGRRNRRNHAPSD